MTTDSSIVYTPKGVPLLNKLGFDVIFFTFGIFFYWLTYENYIFFYAIELGGWGFLAFTNGIKLLFPIVLLAYTGIKTSSFTKGFSGLYILSFGIFLIWAIVPTLFSGSLLEWFKLLPRFLFFVGVVAFFTKRPDAFFLFAKLYIAYVLLALVQYFLIYLTEAYSNTLLIEGVARVAGPFGLLGNVTSMMFFPEATFPFVRLTGFWNEPSNASASAFAAFFLARFLANVEGGAFWRKSSYLCFLAGFLTLSNAGYLAITGAILFGFIIKKELSYVKKLFKTLIFFPISILIVLIVFLGRNFVATYYPDNFILRALTGTRDLSINDYHGGRFTLLQNTFESVGETVIGIGMQNTLHDGLVLSASAPVMWLGYTGVIGILLLFLRESILIIASRSLVRMQPSKLPLAQALIVIMIQHLSYGSWMNPNYFIFAAMILVCLKTSTLQFFSSIETPLKENKNQ